MLNHSAAAGASRFVAYLEGLQRFGIRPGLQRIEALLAAASSPHHRYPLVLVGGTNGKGSTCEFLARALAAQYGTVGLFTSPHLYRWNERIRVLDAAAPAAVAPAPAAEPEALFPDAVTDAELDDLFDVALPLIRRVARQLGQPTEFEILTFAALWHFARRAVGAAVIEVGLGGRWDATNITTPTVSVITHVALDHCDRLGATREAIASDKVCIARPGRPLVTSETRPGVLKVMRNHCDLVGARLWALRAPAYSCPADRDVIEACLSATRQLLQRHSALPAFQVINAQTAATANWALAAELGRPAPLTSMPRPTAVPGRLEIIAQRPTVIVDGSNNPDGAAQLAAHLRRRFARSKLIFVVGISADKDWRAMLDQWLPLASVFIATRAENPRAGAARQLADYARAESASRALRQHPAAAAPAASGAMAPSPSPPLQVEIVQPVSAALQRARELATPDDVICICGSFYVLGEVQRSAFTPGGSAPGAVNGSSAAG